jgi:NADPH-dependent ferric siderophore reductase
VQGSVIPEADWYLLIGDETALPAISAILELLPPTSQGEAFIEVADASEEQDIKFEAQIKLTWLHRNGVRQDQSNLLETAVRQLDLPNDGVYAWVTAESAPVKAIRNYLREERGLARQAVYAVPYWKAGLSEEVYHDERHRVMDDEE